MKIKGTTDQGKAQLQCTTADPSHRPNRVYWARSTWTRCSHCGVRAVSVSPSFCTRIGPYPGCLACRQIRRFRLSGLLSLLANHSFSPISSSSSPEGEQPGGGGASSSRPWKKMSYLLPHLHSGWAVDQAILAEEERLVIIRFGHDWDETCMQVSSNLLTLDSNHL